MEIILVGVPIQDKGVNISVKGQINMGEGAIVCFIGG